MLREVIRVLVVVVAGAMAPALPAETLEGQYHWKDGDERGPVSAIFENAGAETWTVEFRFRFDGREHRYAGTATGKLDNGELNGTVQNENGRRSFTFRGTVRDGRFEGTHAETTRGRTSHTGSIWLRTKV
jgi:hypothetical protein